MYSRRATLTIPGSTNSLPLRNFADSVYHNPMYETIMEQLRDTAGFVKKSHSLIESINAAYLINEIVFDTKENFDQYVNDPSIVSLWEYLISLAKESDIQTEIVDSEQVLNV